MTNPQRNTLVLKDEAGDYFLLPEEMLKGIRVPEEHKARIEQLLAELQDTQGYMWHAILTPIAVIGTLGYLLGREIYKQNQGVESLPAPDLSSVMSSSGSRP